MAWKFRNFRFAPLEKLRGGDIKLSLGLPDPRSLPKLSIKPHTQYPPFSGIPELKQHILEFIGYGEACLVTSGSQQALDLLARASRGDIWAFETTYFSGIDAFRLNRKRIHPFSSIDELKPSEGDLIYLNPDFSNPTGELMPLPMRKEIADIANRHGAVIIEDIAYRHLYFERKPPRLVSEFSDSYAIVGSFSKIFGGGLRTGFIISSARAIEKLSKIKSVMDIATSSIAQQAILKLFPYMKQHVEFIRDLYRKKRDVMWKHGRKLPGRKKRPGGGFFLWVETDMDMSEAFPEIVEKGVSYVPGEFFSLTGRKNGFRLSFSYETEERIEKGMKLLLEWFGNAK